MCWLSKLHQKHETKPGRIHLPTLHVPVAMTETRARLRNDAEDHARGLGGWPRVLRDQLMLFAPDGCALFLNRPDAWVCRVNAPLTQCVLAGSMGKMPRETNVVRPG